MTDGQRNFVVFVCIAQAHLATLLTFLSSGLGVLSQAPTSRRDTSESPPTSVHLRVVVQPEKAGEGPGVASFRPKSQENLQVRHRGAVLGGVQLPEAPVRAPVQQRLSSFQGRHQTVMGGEQYHGTAEL